MDKKNDFVFLVTIATGKKGKQCHLLQSWPS